MAVRDTHLVHPAGQEVVGQMQPPVVPGATRLPEGTRVYQYEATRWTGPGSAGASGAASSSPNSQSSQSLLFRRRLRHAASEMSARPISTAHAPRRRVDSGPST